MRLLFMATGTIGLPLLRQLCQRPEDEVVGVVTQPDRPSGRGGSVHCGPVKAFADARGIPVVQPDSLRTVETRRLLRSFESDLGIVIAYGMLLPGKVLRLPRLGCVNVHASLLPRHRGASPVQAAILAGDAESGLTIIAMDEGLDTGDILSRRALALRLEETGESLHQRLADLAPEVVGEVLDQLRRGTARRTPQDVKEATLTHKLERADGEIDWSSSAEELERRIRAFHSWPGAWTLIPRRDGARSLKLKIFPPVGVDLEGGEEPGRAQVLDGDGLAVETALGRLVLGEVQLEGRRRMGAAEFLRGFKLASGTRFGRAVEA
ncbi:MAG TPA: methionyl-tRNA formyltransferase [Verrucomicrobiales bacterium]|nr:methionyl-tRNA formyltransferase [Verrucomicrobiales bacterium]